jgi:hypothetical protein
MIDAAITAFINPTRENSLRPEQNRGFRVSQPAELRDRARDDVGIHRQPCAH